MVDFEISRATHGAALLVLGARHHGWLVGSVSKATVAHPPCPVVVVPAPVTP
jgi:nucleotide-binding universal stress UspA family protein